MNKELLTIEFRYYDIPINEDFSGYTTKTITIGIYDTLDEAIKEGNKALEILSKKFEVRSNDKFQKNFLFGSPKRLVTNVSYKDKIKFFAQITKMNFDDLNETIDETFKALERFNKYKTREF